MSQTSYENKKENVRLLWVILVLAKRHEIIKTLYWRIAFFCFSPSDLRLACAWETYTSERYNKPHGRLLSKSDFRVQNFMVHLNLQSFIYPFFFLSQIQSIVRKILLQMWYSLLLFWKKFLNFFYTRNLLLQFFLATQNNK